MATKDIPNITIDGVIGTVKEDLDEETGESLGMGVFTNVDGTITFGVNKVGDNWEKEVAAPLLRESQTMGGRRRSQKKGGRKSKKCSGGRRSKKQLKGGKRKSQKKGGKRQKKQRPGSSESARDQM